jgi:hypothetical protein
MSPAEKSTAGSFWKTKTAEELSIEQGVLGPQPLDEMIGAAADLWDSDADFEEFLADLDRARHEATSA